MPGGRRNTSSRTGPTGKSQYGFSVSSNILDKGNNGDRILTSGGDYKKVEECYGGKLLAPSHVPIPMVPIDGPLTFEALSLVVSVIAACLQLLNLYRSVWWLSQSYNAYSMNFYLIDPYLVLFIATMIARRFIYVVLQWFIDISSLVHWFHITQKLLRIILLIIILDILSWCLYHIAERHNVMKIFYLCYPSMSVYFLMFGVNIAPFFDMSVAPKRIKEDKRMKYLLDTPLHNCSLNASAIRAEVCTFSTDFNRRLKRALFASSSTAYVCGVAPIIFVPQYLHFNVSWVIQYVVLFWFGRISAHFAQAYPVRYCDVLHRAALHLGKWIKIENRNNHVYVQAWNDAVLWPHGSIVRYNKEVYRSEGLCTVAEPGNRTHSRFHTLFSNPTMLLSSLLGLQLLLVGVQLLILIRTTEWYQVLSMTLLLVINYYTLFKVARDYLICWKVYRAEQIIQEKCQMLINNSTT